MLAFISKDASRCSVGASSRLLLVLDGGETTQAYYSRGLLHKEEEEKEEDIPQGPRAILDTFRGKRKMGAISGLDKTPQLPA